jgi:colicin import membrane protein
MRYTQLLIASLGIGVFSQALAVDPPSQAATPAATAAPASLSTAASPEDPAAAAEQAKAEAKAKADAQAKADADAKAKAIDKSLRAQGYKPRDVNGTLRYCRGEQALGSRFERQVCGTPEELAFAEQQGKETVRQIQLNNGSVGAGK